MPSLIISLVFCILLYIFQPQWISTHTISISLLNIPAHLHKLSTYSEILSHLANSSSPLCRGSVLFNPQTSVYYFRNPSKHSSHNINSYFQMKCRKIPYYFHNHSHIQIFKLEYADIKQIVSNNDNSIFRLGLQEVSDVKLGFEMSLFPVKFYKNDNHHHNKTTINNNHNNISFICYDSFKVLGLDSKHNDYFILSAKNIYEIVHCYSVDVHTSSNYINNYFRFSSYCDELCHEDFIFLSKDLIRCQCDFDTTSTTPFSHTTVDKYKYHAQLLTNRIITVDNKSNQIDIKDSVNNVDENYYDYEHLRNINSVYLRIFNSNGIAYNGMFIIFALQLLYLFCIYSNKKYIFIKLSIFFYFSVFMILYVLTQITLIINYSICSYETFYIITKLYAALCPIMLIITNALTSNYINVNTIALSIIIVSMGNIIENNFTGGVMLYFVYNAISLLILYIRRTNINDYSLNAYLSTVKIKLLIQITQVILKYSDVFNNVNDFLYMVITIKSNDFVLGNTALFIQVNKYIMNGKWQWIMWVVMRYLTLFYLGGVVVNGFSYIKKPVYYLWKCDIKKLMIWNMRLGMELVIGNKHFKNIRSKILFTLILVNQVFIVKESVYLLIIHILIGCIINIFDCTTSDDNNKLHSLLRASNSTTNLQRITLNNNDNILQLDDAG